MGSLLPTFGLGCADDFSPTVKSGYAIPTHTRAHTQTHRRKENKWLPNLCVEHFLGLSAILILSSGFLDHSRD